MHRAVTIRNFRCFSYFSIEPLERINLLTGRNNVGKTALLEALLLLAGPSNPELPIRMGAIRGVQRFTLDAEELWGWLFFRKETDAPIELESLDDGQRTSKLTIAIEEPGQEVVTSQEPSGEMYEGERSVTTETQWPGLVLDYEDGAGERRTSRASLVFQDGKTAIRLQATAAPDGALGVLISRHATSPREDARRFSKLRRVGAQAALLDGLRILEPRLTDLSLLVSGGQPILHGDVGIGELLPLPYMGAGMVRLASVLLAIATAAGGTVLVDEIESGFHHTALRAIWRAIASAVRQYDVQFFASTHSWECIRAAHEAFSSGERYDFRVHRLQQTGDETRSVSWSRERLEEAIRTNADIR